MSSKKEKFCVIEQDSFPLRISVVWGPFSSEEKANEFCNARVALLAKEWDNSSALIDAINWKIYPMSNVD